MLDIIEDIENFIRQLEKRRGELEELKDEILIFSDAEFIDSIQRGLSDLEQGRSKVCSNLEEVKKLFEDI